MQNEQKNCEANNIIEFMNDEIVLLWIIEIIFRNVNQTVKYCDRIVVMSFSNIVIYTKIRNILHNGILNI